MSRKFDLPEFMSQRLFCDLSFLQLLFDDVNALT